MKCKTGKSTQPSRIYRKHFHRKSIPIRKAGPSPAGARSLCMAFVLLFCTSLAWGNETMIVNKAFNGKEIELRAGEIIRIELEELGTAGYVWEIMNLDSDHFEVLKVATKDRSRPGIVGAPVLKVWLIRAKEPGKCELKFLCYRPWECEANAADTFLLKVRIL